MTTDRERRIYRVMQDHVIPTEGSGGTASGSYCICSCGERNVPRSGLRSDALAKARLHVVREVLKEIDRKPKTQMQRGLCIRCFRSVALTRNKRTGEWYYRPHKDPVRIEGQDNWCIRPGTTAVCPGDELEYLR